MKWPTYEQVSEGVFRFVVGSAVGAAMGAVVIWLLQSPETRFWPVVRAFKPPPPVEQPATVEAFVARLRTSPLLSTMDAKPSSCSRVPKGRGRDRCFYRAGKMEIVVAWYRRSAHVSGLTIRTTEPRGSASFSWPGVGEIISMSCGLNLDQANADVRDIPEKLSQATWYYKGQPASADADIASRQVVIKPLADCQLVSFSESAMGKRVQRMLLLRPTRGAVGGDGGIN